MVVLDGQMVVRPAHTDSILIENIVAGMTEVRIAAGSGATRVERDLQVDIEVGQVTTIPLGAPQGEHRSGWFNAGFSIAAIIVSAAINRLLF